MKNNLIKKDKDLARQQAERLMRARINLGFINVMDFYEKEGRPNKAFSYSGYQKNESGERPLSKRSAILFAKLLKVTPEWLLYGEKENFDSELFEIDIIDENIQLSSGNFSLIKIGKQLISTKDLKQLTNSEPKNIKIMKVRGDPMEPTINDSDVIWMDVSYKIVKDDGIYIFKIGEKLIARRVRINFLNNSMKITSDNEKYPPIDSRDMDEIRVFGKVIAINKMLG